MSRTKLWWLMTFGGIVYYIVKAQLGFDVDLRDAIEDQIASMYWSGAALWIHWFVADKQREAPHLDAEPLQNHQ